MRKNVLIFIALIITILCLSACHATPDKNTEANTDADIYLTLVNKTHQLPDNWEDQVQIETVTNSLGELVQIECVTYEQFLRLRDALLKEGIQIELDSVYRSVTDQEELWGYFTIEYGEDYTRQYVAVPGYSEHHTGLAVDIFLIKDGEVIRENDDMIADAEDFAKIHSLLPKYGFILRYPEGKEDITGYAYEPWHIRYVGSSSIAREIAANRLTLEEYLDTI